MKPSRQSRAGATLLGLAFKLFDPEKIQGYEEINERYMYEIKNLKIRLN